MASRLFSRVPRRIIAGAPPISGSPAWGEPLQRLSPAGGLRPLGAEGLPRQMTRSLQQPFTVNPTLQRFGFSTSTSTMEASRIPAGLGSNGGKVKMALFSFQGIQKVLPYNFLFGWIDEIILDYVHHEVSRKWVLLYLRLFLIVVMKDVFISCYDILSLPAS